MKQATLRGSGLTRQKDLIRKLQQELDRANSLSPMAAEKMFQTKDRQSPKPRLLENAGLESSAELRVKSSPS